MAKKSRPDVIRKISAWGIVLWVVNYPNRWNRSKDIVIFYYYFVTQCCLPDLYDLRINTCRVSEKLKILLFTQLSLLSNVGNWVSWSFSPVNFFWLPGDKIIRTQAEGEREEIKCLFAIRGSSLSDEILDLQIMSIG